MSIDLDMTMNTQQLQALRLISNGARLTDFGNTVVSRQVSGLLSAGLIAYARGWMGYAITPAGRAIQQCHDGYPSCRIAEATGMWCEGQCQAAVRNP